MDFLSSGRFSLILSNLYTLKLYQTFFISHFLKIIFPKVEMSFFSGSKKLFFSYFQFSPLDKTSYIQYIE